MQLCALHYTSKIQEMHKIPANNDGKRLNQLQSAWNEQTLGHSSKSHAKLIIYQSPELFTIDV